MKGTRLKERFFQQFNVHSTLVGLFDLLPGVSFFVKDRQGRFMALNRRGCEYCGVATEEEAIGKTDHDFFPRSRADEYRADDWKVMSTGVAIHNRIESAPESAGSPRLVMTSKLPIFDDGGRVVGLTGYSRQVDEIRKPTGTVTAFADVIEYMHTHFSEKLMTDQLASMANLSVSQFERRFRRAFGGSVRQYLLRVRVEHAVTLLSESQQTVSQIALQCGFFDHAHFNRSFRKIMNTTPTEWRKRNQSV